MRRYQGAQDLHRAQAALMAWTREAGGCHLLHKGDIGHRLFNFGFGQDPADVMRLWLDDRDRLRAFALLYPQEALFDLQMAPQLWLSDRHAAIFEYCEREMLRLGQGIKKISVEAFAGDADFAAFLRSRGYTCAGHSLTMTRHDLLELPAADLPAGFRFHDADAEEAERLADVHNHSFSRKWNAETYGQVFRSPHMEAEMVVVAPDGRFAAFTNVWIDGVNRSLLFEPVGTHVDFRRRGIGKALMVHVLKRMRAERGIKRAFVCHAPPSQNPAAAALYASVGFLPLRQIHEYSKPLEKR